MIPAQTFKFWHLWNAHRLYIFLATFLAYYSGIPKWLLVNPVLLESSKQLCFWQWVFPSFSKASSYIACKRFLCRNWPGKFSEFGIVLTFPVESFIPELCIYSEIVKVSALSLSVSSTLAGPVFASPSLSSSAGAVGFSVL